MRTLNGVLCAAVLAVARVSAADPDTPDGWITTKAKLSLMSEGELKSANIHVDTNGGVVTLYGRVRDEAQRQKAAQLAQEVKGVREVKNLLQVVPESQERLITRADQDIRQQAEKMLKDDLALRDSAIKVKSVDKGVVLLSGKASTFSDQLRAVSDIDKIAGVRRVVSEVKGPESYGAQERQMAPTEKKDSMTDTRITMMVKIRLLGATEVPGLDVNVDARDGVVTLFGIVPNAASKQVAEREATKVSGVERVQNELEVVPSAQRQFVAAKDSAIERDLNAQLKNRPEFRSVNFQARNGAVRLTGTVDSAWDRLEVARMARLVTGVRAVHEELTVTPPRPEKEPLRN